ncbi:hypothetical protein [Geodermatophilus obscurus]|nr:hypothetical protein [Geodermatophilus obscurus]
MAATPVVALAAQLAVSAAVGVTLAVLVGGVASDASRCRRGSRSPDS